MTAATAVRKRHRSDGSVWEVERQRGDWGWHVRCVMDGRVERVGNEMGVAHEYWDGDNWAPVSPAPKPVRLSVPMRDLLWRVAQHKYGWCYPSRSCGQFQTAEGLARRGLVTIDVSGSDPSIAATGAGRAEIERRWPVSPFALGTYEHQPDGWDPPEGRPVSGRGEETRP